MRFRPIIILPFALCSCPDWADAALYQFSKSRLLKGRRLGLVISLDPYKSFASISLDLKRRRPIDRTQSDQTGMDQVMDTEGQPGQTKEEINFYWHLFRKSLKPGYILFEADYFPLTHTGIRFFKGSNSNFRYISAGYDQYFSYTVFLGELLPFFTRNPSEKRPHQTGYTAEIPIDPSIEYNTFNDFFRQHRLTYRKFLPYSWLRNATVEIKVGFTWERIKFLNPTRLRSNYALIIGPNVSF